MYLSESQKKKLEECQTLLLDILMDREFYERCVEVGYVSVQNPAVKFTELAKEGSLDYLSDEEYCEKIEQVEKVSALFGERPYVAGNYRNYLNTLQNCIPDALHCIQSFLSMDMLAEKSSDVLAEIENLSPCPEEPLECPEDWEMAEVAETTEEAVPMEEVSLYVAED